MDQTVSMDRNTQTTACGNQVSRGHTQLLPRLPTRDEGENRVLGWCVVHAHAVLLYGLISLIFSWSVGKVMSYAFSSAAQCGLCLIRAQEGRVRGEFAVGQTRAQSMGYKKPFDRLTVILQQQRDLSSSRKQSDQILDPDYCYLQRK